MKTTTLATLVSLMAAAAAYPAHPFASDRLWARACTPGALVCNGSTQFALCTGADSTPQWMNVSEGTQCVCSGSECTITSSSSPGGSAGDGASSGSAGPPPTFASAPSAAASTAAAPSPGSPPPSFETSSHAAAPAPTAIASSGPPPPPAPSSPTSGAGPSSGPAVPASSSGPAPPSGSVVPAPSAVPGAPVKGSSGYTMFLGDGSAAKGWPEESKWADFESMWSANTAIIASSCKAFKDQDNNSDKETADVKAAVLSVSKEAGIDSRYVLAVVMQESNGCVRAPTTDYGVKNPGLMQSHAGANTCWNVKPCPTDTIVGMIKDGTMGTSSGDGLKQVLARAGSDASKYYKAARMYNSGSIATTGNLQDGIATHCYSSDVANRLLGWASGTTGCKLG